MHFTIESVRSKFSFCTNIPAVVCSVPTPIASTIACVQFPNHLRDAEEIHGAIARELRRNNFVTGGAPSAPPEIDPRDSRIVKKQMDLDMAELRQLATVVQTQQLTEEVVRATKDFWKSVSEFKISTMGLYEFF